MKYLLPIVLLVSVARVGATPSGLNNIPTADTTPMGTFVFQGFSTIGSDRDTDFNLGFKTGLEPDWIKIELGAASHITPGKGGPFTVHGKAAVPFGEGLPTVAAGVVNVAFDSDDRDRAGDEFFYGVVSQDFGWCRIHAGCGTQESEALPFFGIDKTFRAESTPAGKNTAEVIGRELFTLRADAIRPTSHDWLYSAGVLVPVCKFFVMEAWANFPDNGDDVSVTLKANIVFSF
jgi:hypothetical protein